MNCTYSDGANVLSRKKKTQIAAFIKCNHWPRTSFRKDFWILVSIKSFISCFGNFLPRYAPDRALKFTDCLLLAVKKKMQKTGILSLWI